MNWAHKILNIAKSYFFSNSFLLNNISKCQIYSSIFNFQSFRNTMRPIMLSFSFHISLLLRSFLLKKKSLEAPKLTEAIVGFKPNSFSLSLCQPIPTLPDE
jgi:hypothetical protein